jgi:flagellar hook-length control protein FliK
LLDQARDEPASSNRADGTAAGGSAAAENSNRARTQRGGQPKPSAKTAVPAPRPPESPTGPSADRPAGTDDRGDTVELLVAEEASLDGAAAPTLPTSADTAALLASLATLGRPHMAPGTTAGKPPGGGDEAHPGGDPSSTGDTNSVEHGDRKGDISGSAIGAATALLTGAALTRAAPGAMSDSAHAVGQAASGALSAGEGGSAAASAASGKEPGLGADPAAGGPRSFASELQGVLMGPPPGLPLAGPSLASLPAGPTPTLQTHMTASPGSPAFAPELGATLATFVREGVHHARLELNPVAMGPLTVQIELDGQPRTSTCQPRTPTRDKRSRRPCRPLPAACAKPASRSAGVVCSNNPVSSNPMRQAATATHSPNDDRAGDDQRGTSAQPLQAPQRRRGVVDLIA